MTSLVSSVMLCINSMNQSRFIHRSVYICRPYHWLTSVHLFSVCLLNRLTFVIDLLLVYGSLPWLARNWNWRSQTQSVWLISSI